MPKVTRHGDGRHALATLVLGTKLTALIRKRALPSWERYCARHGFDLVIFDRALDDSPRAMGRSPAWQKCLVAASPVLRQYSAVCWIDADIIINDETAPSVFAAVPAGMIGAVEGWASPTPEVYRKFLEAAKASAPPELRHTIDDDAAAYYARFGLPTDYPTVVQSGVIVFDPKAHGPVFREAYDRYEDRGPAWWHYEMRPLSYELHRHAVIAWLDPRFNYNAICDVVALQGETWPDRFTWLDKLASRLPWVPGLSLCYRRQITSVTNAMSRAAFLHFAGFRLGMVVANLAPAGSRPVPR